jgi:hypothetical protein
MINFLLKKVGNGKSVKMKKILYTLIIVLFYSCSNDEHKKKMSNKIEIVPKVIVPKVYELNDSDLNKILYWDIDNRYDHFLLMRYSKDCNYYTFLIGKFNNSYKIKFGDTDFYTFYEATQLNSKYIFSSRTFIFLYDFFHYFNLKKVSYNCDNGFMFFKQNEFDYIYQTDTNNVESIKDKKDFKEFKPRWYILK